MTDLLISHYFHYIDELTGDQPGYKQTHNRIPKNDDSADTLIDIFHQLWRDSPFDLPDADYIHTVKERHDASAREHRDKHVCIMDKLMDQFALDVRQYMPGRGQLWRNSKEIINKLLSLAYCVLHCCYNRAESTKNPQRKYLHLRQFLSDMVITFLLLKSVHVTNDYVGLCKLSNYNFPEIDKISIHLSISPLNSAFKELVLKEILHILYGDSIPRTENSEQDSQADKICNLAKLVYEYFNNRRLGRLKSIDMICHIISDQSRYMAVGSPLLEDIIKDTMPLRRNYVAEKTALGVFAIATNDFHKIINKSKKYLLEKYYNTHFQDPNDYPRVISSLQLNYLHHAILYGISKEFLGADCPRVDKRCWFKNERGGSFDFKRFLYDLARKLIIDKFIKAKHSAKDESLADVHELMSKFALALQYIIYTRWCVSENFHKAAGIAWNDSREDHQRIVIILLAFRTLIMYLLPVKGVAYGIERVASILPNYAKTLQLKLDVYCFPDTYVQDMYM